MDDKEYVEVINTESSNVDSDPEQHYPGKGFQLNEYVLGEVIGHGAMATVFEAIDNTGHEVAIKIFQEGPGVSTTMLERFRREVEVSKKLRRHPHIMTIYSTGRTGPYHYIVMENIENSKTLEIALESTPMSLTTIVELVVKLARALQYAHSKNIIHRDVKPSNIMVDEFGEPLLSDFGVAALIDWPSCTMTGALTGTPLYMSPEQARAEKAGMSSDIYSLCVVLYEALTGVLPYSTQHCAPVKEVLEAVKNELPKRPRLYRKEISPDIEAVMFKALEKDPKDRYVDAEAFAIDLERALVGRGVSAHLFSPLDRIHHFVRQRRHGIVTLLVLMAVVAGLGWYFRQQLLEVHYENLTAQAWRKNAEYQIEESGEGPRHAGWQAITEGNRNMSKGMLDSALENFRKGVKISNRRGHDQTAAIAQVYQARCLTLLGRRKEARRIYRQVLTNNDAPPLFAGMALLESVTLARLAKDDDETILNILKVRDPPSTGPIRQTLDCLAGDVTPKQLIDEIDTIPKSFVNDAYFAAALSYYQDGDLQKYQGYLQKCVESSKLREWPGPFAKILQKKRAP